MSMSHQLDVSCPHCGQFQHMEVWQSINVAQDPNLKEELLNRSLHQLTCMSCGEESSFTLPMLYHDPSHPSMLWLSPGGKPPLENVDMLLDSLPAEVAQRYSFRTVETNNDLIEKIRILDDGLDDRVMELVKLLLLQQMMKKDPETSVNLRMFYSDTETMNQSSKLHFVMVKPDTEKPQVASLPRHVYDGVLSDFRSLLTEQAGWPTVNLPYAAQLFQAFHQSTKDEQPS